MLDHNPADPDVTYMPAFLSGFLYCGSYLKRKGTRPATIALYTDDLYFGVPQLLAASPLAGFLVASTVAHEVGHHAVEAHGFSETSEEIKLNSFIDSETERVAATFAAQALEKMLTSPYYRIGRYTAQLLSNRLYVMGSQAHWKGDFKRAAALEFRAYMVNTENTDAWQAYLEDRQALLKNPSMLSDSERLWISHRRVSRPIG
ncbi:MAG TPA: hypothetical protein VNG71_22985 [Pyrinomonadaceae bacterium]|nr:hypothetical protein [Pyrinomonadaceae bacterium]